jgi:hypothetical protein
MPKEVERTPLPSGSYAPFIEGGRSVPRPPGLLPAAPSKAHKYALFAVAALAFYPTLKIVLAGFALVAFALSALNMVLLAAFVLALILSAIELFQDRQNYTHGKAVLTVLRNLGVVVTSFITIPIAAFKAASNLFAKKSRS